MGCRWPKRPKRTVYWESAGGISIRGYGGCHKAYHTEVSRASLGRFVSLATHDRLSSRDRIYDRANTILRWNSQDDTLGFSGYPFVGQLLPISSNTSGLNSNAVSIISSPVPVSVSVTHLVHHYLMFDSHPAYPWSVERQSSLLVLRLDVGNAHHLCSFRAMHLHAHPETETGHRHSVLL